MFPRTTKIDQLTNNITPWSLHQELTACRFSSMLNFEIFTLLKLINCANSASIQTSHYFGHQDAVSSQMEF